MIAMPNNVQMDELMESMRRMLKTSARMYMHLTKATIDRFGRDGEMTVRYGLRAYGSWRGLEMRAAHHALGLDINMKNLIGCWDNASTYIVKDSMEAEGTYKPYDTRFDVPYCPAAEAWKEAEFFQWGHVYCDEFHQACASAYHPDGNVVIPQNMMKGDDHCHFRWIMPPDAEKLELGEPSELGTRLARDYSASSELEAAWLSLKRSGRLVGGRFVTAARVVLDRHGEAGRQMINEALASWGADRGRHLRDEHLGRGIEPSLQNFVRHHDFPMHLVWSVREIEMEASRVVLEISDTPQDQAWADLGAAELGMVWYEASYPSMAAAYLPGTAVRWTIPRGGSRRLELALAGA